jgi:hypothetical protein
LLELHGELTETLTRYGRSYEILRRLDLLVLGLLGTLISGWLAYERLRGAESLSN